MRSVLSLRSTFASLVVAAALAACGGSSSPSPTTPSGGAAEAPSDDPSCPVAVPGTSVDVEDTDTGAALVFVTTGDVDDLRKRVSAMAQMHNDHHGKMGPLPTGDERGGGHEGHDMSGHDMGSQSGGGGEHAGHDMGGGGEHAGHAGGMISIHSTASAEDVDGGAKVVLVSGGADVGKLQEELRMHAKHLASGSCHVLGPAGRVDPASL